MEENQKIRKQILQIYAVYDKRLGAYKTRTILERDYGIRISVGRVYRLMRDMNLPKMSTDKPTYHRPKADNGNYINHLKQQFSQKAPNLVWTSDSDRGTQYTAASFRKLLDSLNVVQSFSKKGYPFDNAFCESFFKYLKNEETNRRTYATLNDLKLSVFEYMKYSGDLT